MISQNQIKSLGVTTALVILNIALIYVLRFTPLSQVNDFVFQFLIAGMIFYGIMLFIGRHLGNKGIKEDNMSYALAGIGFLEIAYGMFGAGILRYAGSEAGIILAITSVVTVTLAVGSGLLVFWTGRDFSNFQQYSMYAFLGALGTGFVGSFTGIFALITFGLVLIGFILDLIYEIWDMNRNPENVYMNGLGIYIAFMGVFVQILQIVARSYLRE